MIFNQGNHLSILDANVKSYQIYSENYLLHYQNFSNFLQTNRYNPQHPLLKQNIQRDWRISSHM